MKSTKTIDKNKAENSTFTKSIVTQFAERYGKSEIEAANIIKDIIKKNYGGNLK